MSPTFSAFTTSIQNSVNTAGTGALVMEETSGGVTCRSTDGTEGLSGNSAICATINNYGGTSNSKLLTPRGGQHHVRRDQERGVQSPPATAFTAAQSLAPLAAGVTATYAFSVSLDASATNTYQGLQASQPLTWTFGA